MTAAIDIKNLSKSLGSFHLEGVDITLPKGSIMGFIGENGAGKSVTIKLMLDLLHKDGGSVSVLGETLTTESKAIKEHIGVVMDECHFPDMLTSKDVNRLMKQVYKTWDEAKFMGYLNSFNLSDPKKKIKDYSRGMTMKLSIAVALSHDSHLLILDEATSGLDPVVRDEILDVFLDFMQDENHSIFVSSHIISDLEKICDYITFIHQGKILFSHDKEELLEKYVIYKCSKNELAELDGVVGVRENQFGADVLMERSSVPDGGTCDKATIEDIMVYYVRGLDK